MKKLRWDIIIVVLVMLCAFTGLCLMTSCQKADSRPKQYIIFIHSEPDTLCISCYGTVFYLPPAKPGKAVTDTTYDAPGNTPMIGHEYLAYRVHNGIKGEESIPAVVVGVPNNNVITFRKTGK